MKCIDAEKAFQEARLFRNERLAVAKGERELAREHQMTLDALDSFLQSVAIKPVVRRTSSTY